MGLNLTPGFTTKPNSEFQEASRQESSLPMAFYSSSPPFPSPPMLVSTLELDTRHVPRQSQPSEPLGGGDEDWVRLGRPHRTGSF